MWDVEGLRVSLQLQGLWTQQESSLDVTWQRKQSVTNASQIYPLQCSLCVCVLRALGAQSDSASSRRVREVGERHLCVLSHRGKSLRAQSSSACSGCGVCGLAWPSGFILGTEMCCVPLTFYWRSLFLCIQYPVEVSPCSSGAILECSFGRLVRRVVQN